MVATRLALAALLVPAGASREPSQPPSLIATSGAEAEGKNQVAELLQADQSQSISHEGPFGCETFCIVCKKKVSWRVSRYSDKSWIGYGFAITALGTLSIAAPVLLIPLAGTAAHFLLREPRLKHSEKDAGWAKELVRDLLSANRGCPKVEFHEKIHDNSKKWFWQQKEKEKTLHLEDVNLMEFMAGYQTADEKGNPAPIFGEDYARNDNTFDKQARIRAAMACNALTLDQDKWGNVIKKLSHENKKARELLAWKCGEWLCAGEDEVDEVKNLGKMAKLTFKKCGK